MSTDPEAAAKLVADAKSGTKIVQHDLAEALPVLAQHLVGSRTGIGMQGIRGAPSWTNAELALWELSEDVRRLLVRDKVPRGRSPVLDSVAELVRDPALGKGRENFVLMLGERGKGEYTSVLAHLLDDDEVAAHALDALATSRAPGYEEQAERILREAAFPVERQAAKKYLRMARG